MKKDTAPGDGRFGRPWVGVVFSLGLLVLFLGAAVMRVQDVGLSTVGSSVLSLLAWVGIPASVFFAGLFVWHYRAVERDVAVAKLRPSSLVLSGSTSPAFSAGLNAIGLETGAPFGVTVEADATGVRFWRGKSTAPGIFFSAKWPEIVSISRGRLPGASVPYTTLVFEVKRGQTSVRLPVTLIGYGPGGIYSPAPAKAESVLAELERLRT